jgi:hypothetical protein
MLQTERSDSTAAAHARVVAASRAVRDAGLSTGGVSRRELVEALKTFEQELDGLRAQERRDRSPGNRCA